MNHISVRDRRGNKRFFIDNALLRGGWGSFIGPYGIAVYNALALHADADNQTGFPSYATIAKITGMSTRQAIREIERLISWNIIEKESRLIDGGYSSNIYYLLDQTQWYPWQVVTTSSPPYDSQSLPLMTHSHYPSDSQSHKQNTIEQDPLEQIVVTTIENSQKSTLDQIGYLCKANFSDPTKDPFKTKLIEAINTYTAKAVLEAIQIAISPERQNGKPKTWGYVLGILKNQTDQAKPAGQPLPENIDTEAYRRLLAESKAGEFNPFGG